MPSTHHVQWLTFPLRSRLQWRPRFVAASNIRRYTEQVIVPCKANGSITLDIHYPPSTSSTTVQPADAPCLLINLPSGTYKPDSLKTTSLEAAQLAAATTLPVIQINYRLCPSHRFPTPLHDVTHGYDWVVKNLLSSPLENYNSDLSNNHANPSEDFPETAQQTRIGVYGTHIGGSLALSLALTECRTPSSLSSLYEHPVRIAAVATRDAITDWPLLAPLKVDSQVKTLFAGRSDVGDLLQSHEELEELRRSFFRENRLGDFFDPFASPALFFRTAGVELPAKNMLSFLSSRSGSASSLASTSQSSTSHHANSSPLTPPISPATSSDSLSSRDKDQNQAPKSPRFYARRFPPTSMGPTILPSMRLSATPKSIFELQAIEFVKLVQRAMLRQMIPSGAGQRLVDEILAGEEAAEAKSERDELLRDAKKIAEGRAKLMVRNDGEKMDEDAEMVGKWFRRTMIEV